MRTNLHRAIVLNAAQQGISIIELIVFIVVVGLASGALFKSYIFSAQHNADPMIQVRALEAVQSKLDEILALKYDENTPTGGIPACGSLDLGASVCTNTPDANMNDVDDYHGFSDSPYTGYTRSVTVVTAANQKLITVTVAGPSNVSISLAAYRANF
ncbi:MAG TPA: MSHA biogenesis protein MshD [Cellvibrio sp.]|nr:MSHA biogenesis protein MshD [Cellvibrio sp.]